MAKIDLNDVKGGFNLSQINSNFNKIEQALNEKVLYRDNPEGEANQMLSPLDMNGQRVYNLPEPVLNHEPAHLCGYSYSIRKMLFKVPGEPFVLTILISHHYLMLWNVEINSCLLTIRDFLQYSFPQTILRQNSGRIWHPVRDRVWFIGIVG